MAAVLSLLINNPSDYSGITWTTPISRLLCEDFVLSDKQATAHVTVEDALNHGTGYPRQNLAIAGSTLPTPPRPPPSPRGSAAQPPEHADAL